MLFFFLNDTAPTEIYPLPLHDPLPISDARQRKELGIAHIPEDRHRRGLLLDFSLAENTILGVHYRRPAVSLAGVFLDRKSTRLNSSHLVISYAVFCLKTKNKLISERAH